MSSRFRTAVLLLTLIVSSTFAACSGSGSGGDAGGSGGRKLPAGWPEELTLGLAGGVDSEAAMEGNKPLAALIEKATGVRVELYHAGAYSSVIQAMRAKRVDALQVGVFSYLLAVQEANAEALGVYVNTFAVPAVYDPRLRPEYYSVVSVKKGSGITKLSDLRGRTFTFVEPASTSGHLVAKTELIKAGLTPDKDFKTRFSGCRRRTIRNSSRPRSAGLSTRRRSSAYHRSTPTTTACAKSRSCSIWI
jgi:phosphonate transport system substrate-binding protein